jgi:transcriptional regulator with XRE-family HTH domain
MCLRSSSTCDRGRDVRQIFGQNLRRFRNAKGWSQEKLAEHARLHRTYVGAVERGERNISLLNIVRLAQALRITSQQLVEGTAEQAGCP